MGEKIIDRFGFYLLLIPFILPAIFIVYILPEYAFTCSGGNDYNWCNKYISANISIIDYEDGKPIGYYFEKNIREICTIHDYSELHENGYLIEGYYQRGNMNKCVDANHRNEYIKDK